MKLLGIETSTHHLSVALLQGNDVTSRGIECASGGSELLLPWIHDLLSVAGLRIGDLDGIAFGAGPGGFTGVRLACGVVQGLAWGLQIPVVPVSTLEALALASGCNRVWTCLDARMAETYCAAYDVAGDVVTELMAPTCVEPSLAPVPGFGGMWGVGDGFVRHGDALRARKGDLLGVRPDVWPTAEAVLRIARARLASGMAFPVEVAHPIYVRDKVALTTAEWLARGGAK